jgi:uncharacterized membrane protein
MEGKPDELEAGIPASVEKQIISKVPSLKNLPEAEQKELLEVFANCSIAVHKSFCGPLPSPEALEDYNRVVPGLADRIVSMTEGQQKHRMTLESSMATSQQKQSQRGQIFAFLLTILLITCGGILAFTNHTAAGVTIFSTTIIGVAATFIANQVRQASELSRKKQLVPERTSEKGPQE